MERMMPSATLPPPWPVSRNSTTPAQASARAVALARPSRSPNTWRQIRATNTGYIKCRVVAVPTPI